MNKLYTSSIVSLVFALVFIASATPAHADPHAVFYTDRAQEQLFYNVLAALNQADYVEPGIPGSPYSRSALEGARNTTAQQQSILNGAPSPLPFISPGPVEASTHTNLPSVVTRNITLEGNDLWTAYLYQQFTLETDTRRSLSKLASLYCQNTLGRAGCSDLPGPAQEQSTTFPTDANAYAQGPNLSVVGALSEKTAQEEQLRNTLTGTGIGSNQFNLGGNGPSHPGPEANLPPEIKVTRASAPDIGSLRDNNKNNKDALSVINDVTSSVIAAQYSTGIDPNVFSNITFTDGGKTAKFAEHPTFDEYVNTLGGIGSLLNGSIQVADQAYERGVAFQQNRAQTPSLGQYVLTKNVGGGVDATVITPSSAIAANINASANFLPNQVIGEKIAGIQENTIPGQEPLLPITVPTTLPIAPQVAGISTVPLPTIHPQGGGQVAGTVSIEVPKLYRNYFDSEQNQPNNVTTGTIPFYEESLPAKLLSAMGITIPNKNPKETTCGFCTDLQNIIKPTGTTSTTSGVFSELYCYFFPTVESCVKTKQPVPTVRP